MDILRAVPGWPDRDKQLLPAAARLDRRAGIGAQLGRSLTASPYGEKCRRPLSPTPRQRSDHLREGLDPRVLAPHPIHVVVPLPSWVRAGAVFGVRRLLDVTADAPAVRHRRLCQRSPETPGAPGHRLPAPGGKRSYRCMPQKARGYWLYDMPYRRANNHAARRAGIRRLPIRRRCGQRGISPGAGRETPRSPPRPAPADRAAACAPTLR